MLLLRPYISAYTYVLTSFCLQIGLGICMDLNPYEFTAPFTAYEFAQFHRTSSSSLLLCAMNWLAMADTLPALKLLHRHGDRDSSDDGTTGRIRRNGERAHVENMVGYWVARLQPLLGEQCVVVVANRVGEERGMSMLCVSGTCGTVYK